ncbi:MAG: toprim domain-containing protein [Planctomycetes bacterium]|jgi:putative DNA primase/helicase|nr:toprim domain-containing protein [Planctomycetota bacterium]
MKDDVEDFIYSIQAAGLIPPEWPLQVDGQIHRYATNGRRSDDAGWYVLHMVYTGRGTRLYGAAGDWRSGTVVFWHSGGETQSPSEAAALRVEIERQQRERARERRERHHRGRQQAEALWAAATSCAEPHPYLTAKGLPADFGLGLDNGDLLVPMRDWNGDLHNLQRISPEGRKLYGSGRAAGLVHVMGRLDGRSVILAEGYATARSALLADLAETVVVAFSAGQLKAAATEIRRRFPRALRWVLADNDRQTPGNPGLTAAKEAATAIGGNVLVPDDGSTGSCDFNDLWRSYGSGAHSCLIEVTP